MEKIFSSHFACSECKGTLTLDAEKDNQDSVVEGTFSCLQCNLKYPIFEEIPRFVNNLEKIQSNTAYSFGYKWEKFSQIDEWYKKNFLDELRPLEYESFFRGKRVLDAGTGIGIPSYCIAELGAKEVFGIDITTSIENAHRNNKGFKNVTIAQADIYKIPFPRESFDVVVCVAVLQHLPDPQKAFEELISYVKPGGTLILWVYGKEGNAFVEYFVEPFRKIITRRLPVKATLALSYILGILFQLVAIFIYKPLNLLKINWLPLNDYIVYRTRFDWKMNTHMVFDQLLAPLSYLFRREEVEQLFSHPAISEFVIRHHNKNSWTAYGTKNQNRIG
jgi:SAM-dependent methyltransferase